MTLEQLKESMPDYAKDIKLNLTSVLTDIHSGLTQMQTTGIALASAYATKNNLLIKAMQNHAETILTNEHIKAAKAAVAIMAMNNIYYRFVHLVSDKEYAKLPARLRMNIIANPGVDKIDFELYALAVAAINGCGMCINSHIQILANNGLIKEMLQDCIRIASTINAVAQVLQLE